MTAKLQRDVAANAAKIESVDFDRSLAEQLNEIDFEAIADHWLARFWGYRRRERTSRFVKSVDSGEDD